MDNETITGVISQVKTVSTIVSVVYTWIGVTRRRNFTIFTGEYCEKLFTSAGVRNHLENTTIMYCSGTDVSSKLLKVSLDFTYTLFCVLQDTSSWSCKGDSGSPLVVETSPRNHTLVGILHGSRLSNCTPGNNQKIPGLFANLEHEDNLNFVEKWLPLGEYFASHSQNSSDPDIFYKDYLHPFQRIQYLWSAYPDNDEVYKKIFFDVCKDLVLMNNSLETYGMNCSLYNSMVNEVCQNGFPETENFERFEVNCSSKHNT